MQRLLFCVSFGLGFLLLLWHCQLEDTPQVPKVFQSSFSSRTFKDIEQEMYQLQFPLALELLQGLIDQKTMSPLEERQAYLHAAFLNLSLEQTSKGWDWVKRFLHSSPNSAHWKANLKAHYYLVKGMAEYQELKLIEAKATLQRALPLLQKVYTNNHYYVSVALSQLGLVLFDIDNTQVLKNEYIEHADAIFQYNPELNRFNWEMRLGKALQAHNDRSFQGAESEVRQALFDYKKLPFELPIFHARCLMALGQALKKKEEKISGGSGDFQVADSCLQLAAHLIHPSNSIRLQECYRDLCVLYIQSKVYQQRFQNQFQDLLALLKVQKRDVFGFPDRILARRDFELSKLDFSHTSSPEAEDRILAQRVIDSYEFFLAKNHLNPYHRRHLDEAYFILERALAFTQNYHKLVYYNQKSTELLHPEKHSDKYKSIVGVPMDTTEVAVWIACGWQAEYKFLEALQLKGSAKITELQKALALYRLFDSHFFTSILNTNEDGLVGFQNEVGNLIYPNAVAACYEYHQIKKDEYSLNLALQFMERQKAYLLYRNMLKRGKTNHSVSALQSEWNNLYYVLNLEQYKGSQKALWQRFNQVDKALKKALKRMAIDTLAYQNEIKQPSATIGEIQQNLHTDQQVLQYMIGRGSIFILAINKDHYCFAKVSEPNLSHWVNLFLAPLRFDKVVKTSQLQQYHQYGRKLYSLLIEPVESIVDSGKTTIIIPDQDLHFIPFEALLKHSIPVNAPFNFKKAPYFLFDGPVEYSPSWKIYKEKAKRNLDQITLNPASFWVASDVLRTQEIQTSLQRIFGRRLEIFNAGDCQPKFFLKELPRLRGLVHLSIHAKSNIYDRHDNKLCFPGKLGEVRGFEVSGKDLHQIDLLVLAACSSNFGQTSSEGTFSLTRSFSQAGVGAIVSTLWDVDNIKTNQVLEKMYKHLAQNCSLAEALWLAKKEFITESTINVPGAWSGVVLSK